MFGSYKLPIADVIDGRLRAVPKAVFAAAGAMRGARGGVDIPDADRKGVIRHLEKYYAKMDLESPFDVEERRLVRAAEAKEMTAIGLETALRKGSSFSHGAARILRSRFEPGAPVIPPADPPLNLSPPREELDLDKLQSLLNTIQGTTQDMKSRRAARS